MAGISRKLLDDKGTDLIFRSAYTDDQKIIAVGSFLNTKVGHKITVTNFQVNPAIDDIRFLDVFNTISGTTTSGFPQVTGLQNATSLYLVGQCVIDQTGVNIPANSTILSIDSNTQITLSQNATASGSISIKFANLLCLLRNAYSDAIRSLLLDSERLK